MEFLSPDLVGLLLFVPLLGATYLWSLRRRRPLAVRYSSLSLVRPALSRWWRVRLHLPFVLFAGALAALAVAPARPALVLSHAVNEATIVLALDVSGSMCSTDVAPSRLQAAEDAAASFIASQSARTRVGIVAFSTFAELVQAPTIDQPTLLAALDSLQTGPPDGDRQRDPDRARRHQFG
jgi:Ca-activated chloride channel family protein